jgi:hypothetical protein
VLEKALAVHHYVRMVRQPAGGSAGGPPAPGPVAGHTNPGRSGSSATALAFGIICVLAGLATLLARILFVRWGILYGAAAVSHVDAIVAALIVIGLALIAWGRSGRKTTQTTSTDPDSGSQWTNWATGITALAATAALVVSLMNLFDPLTPPRLATSACPGARVNNVPYVGITAGPDGVNSRQGPSRSYLPNGRFAGNCSVGFDVYCLGDPIEDVTGTTSDEFWMTSRWLRVAKQPPGWRSTMARILSGENPQPQFMSDAFITPESPYDQLPIGNARQCPGNFPYPGQTHLQPFNAQADTLTASADHAVNMGFAVWVPPRQGFINSDAYLQIFTSGAGQPNNPGEAAPDGTKSVEWTYGSSLQSQLHPAANQPGTSGHVVILAVACLADNIPAKTSTAAIAGYKLSQAGPPLSSSVIPSGMDKNRLARAACEAST